MKRILVCICFALAGCCPPQAPDAVPKYKYGDRVTFAGHKFFREQPAIVHRYIPYSDRVTYTVRLEDANVMVYGVPETYLSPESED